MANITPAADPSFNTTMEAMDRNTPAHYAQFNTRNEQLLNNDQYLYDNKVTGPGLEFTVTNEGILRLYFDE